MFAMIMSLVSSIVSGVVGPAFVYLGKKQDVTLDGFKAGTTADQAAYQAWCDYQIKIETLKLSANSWWGPRLLYMIVGLSASLHTSAIILDSTFSFGWGIPKVPAPYDGYEAWVVGSLFVVSLTAGPASAVTAWLHRR